METLLPASGSCTDPLALPIVRAAESDAHAICALLTDAATWLWERGIRQWHPNGFNAPEIARGIAEYETYLVAYRGEALGTLRLQWSDPAIWGDERGDDGTAGYIHQFAVARSMAGSGLAPRLLRFAEERIAAQQRPLLRLDCWSRNTRLREYYAGAGFTLVCPEVSETIQASLWERAVASAAPMA